MKGGGTGCGLVYRLDPKGMEATLYTFTGGADGAFFNVPTMLLREKAGNLYGTAPFGGELSACSGIGCGVIFALPPAAAGDAWTETTLHRFTGSDGWQPTGGLIGDAAGNLYGTTSFGGELSACGGTGCGTVFRLDRAGKETVLYTFTADTRRILPGSKSGTRQGWQPLWRLRLWGIWQWSGIQSRPGREPYRPLQFYRRC